MRDDHQVLQGRLHQEGKRSNLDNIACLGQEAGPVRLDLQRNVTTFYHDRLHEEGHRQAADNRQGNFKAI